MLKRANEAGIPVIVVNLLEPIPDVDVASYIGFDNTRAPRFRPMPCLTISGGPGVLGTGEKVKVEPGQYLDLEFWQKLYGGLTAEQKAAIKARGAIIEGIAGGFFSTARVKGFNEVLKDYPGITLAGNTCAADWNREKGVKCTEDIMQSNPDGLDFIWAAANEMGLGAIRALAGAGGLRRPKWGRPWRQDGCSLYQ